jgi:hypothetical protein
MAFMRAKHPVFGVKDVADTKFNREVVGWVEVDPSTPTTEQENRRALNDVLRDPGSRKADEVVTVLEGAPEGAKDAVIAAEKSGKARKTVLDAD